MKTVILFLALSSGFVHARSSGLPVLFKCEQPAIHECHEFYFSFEPGSAPACGIGSSVRGMECPKVPDFLGACRSAIQGGGGYQIQTVLFYYSGHTIGDSANVEKVCHMANGEYIR
jgi:hypothetical protein